MNSLSRRNITNMIHSKIIEFGSYYFPAWKHYNHGANVVCDRCLRNNLTSCIGYLNQDLCLRCADEVTNSDRPICMCMLDLNDDISFVPNTGCRCMKKSNGSLVFPPEPMFEIAQPKPILEITLPKPTLEITQPFDSSVNLQPVNSMHESLSKQPCNLNL